ncbi:MAG: bifunctional DNA-binding transcriptional regulator/O6-methylguanine-DNA methyltransferase Ada [bacterium]|nr:bifunctional DNA-binding transcriptional regulator/O6-methylguanine-DNA methyltransferase Ada [bacterium]
MSAVTGERQKRAQAGVPATAEDPRWAAVVARDRGADGAFYYSVRTTGVYCRPSCGARRPRMENVGFYATTAAAEAAGFRACKRCQPAGPSTDSRQAELVARVVRILEESENTPTLEALATETGVSPYHLHRVFKSRIGLTPAAYARAHRAQRMRAELDRLQSVTDAIFEAGYGSSSRFYEQSQDRLGMTPGQFRAGGAGAEIRFAVGESYMGALLVACSAVGVCAISLGDDPDQLVRELQDRFPQARMIGADAQFERLIARVVGQIEEPTRAFADGELPLDVRGTAFQQRVWQALREIPIGETRSYAKLAAEIGRPGGARAVARACAANSLAVAIPCHRVIRGDGALSGYRWGVERKRMLLEREGALSSDAENAGS